MELNKIFELSKQYISPRICFIRKLGRNVFEACEHKKNKKEKIVYFFQVNDDRLNVFNTMELEI